MAKSRTNLDARLQPTVKKMSLSTRLEQGDLVSRSGGNAQVTEDVIDLPEAVELLEVVVDSSEVVDLSEVLDFSISDFSLDFSDC